MRREHVPLQRFRFAAGPLGGPAIEKRDHPRVRLRVPIAFRAVAAHPAVRGHGVTLDVGRGGVRFRAQRFVPPGEFLALEVDLPGRGTHAVRGRSVWVREARGDGAWEVGAAFLRVGGDGDAALADLLLLST
jgi:hypothetical protein